MRPDSMPKFDITTIGEIMLRLSVPAGQRLETAAQFDVQPAGAESNVASLLARLGRRSAWLGALPDSALGRLAANHLRMAGVDLDGVIWCAEGRMGAYYVEFSGPPRPTQVIYDRADSCAAQLQPEQVQWDHLLDTRLLHLTGITPALSPSCCALVAEAIARARAAAIPVSFDVNYRQKLWGTVEAAQVLLPFLRGIDLLSCGQGDAARLFQCSGQAEEMIHQLADLTQARVVVMSVGDGGVLAWDGTHLHRASALPVQVVDRLGAGDALAAGVIHGWLDGDLPAGLQYGVALAALALSQHGDMVVTTPGELKDLLGASGSTIQR